MLSTKDASLFPSLQEEGGKEKKDVERYRKNSPQVKREKEEGKRVPEIQEMSKEKEEVGGGRRLLHPRGVKRER